MDQSMDSQSQSEGGINEEDNVIKQSEGTICETPGAFLAHANFF